MKYLVWRLLLLVALGAVIFMLWGCDGDLPKSCKQFTFYNNNQKIVCEDYWWGHCGYRLKKCSDNIEYDCVTNVQVKEHLCHY